MDEPHLTDCCGHHYCESCLSKWQTTTNGHTCPFCRGPNFNHMHDKCVDREIQGLQVKCPNFARGCLWTGCLSDTTAHFSGKKCEVEIVSCPLECGEKFERKYAAEHVAHACRLRDVTCEHCNVVVQQHVLGQHLSQCDQFLMHCPEKCDSEVRRCELNDHLNFHCPRRIVPCTFHDVGCNATIRQCDLAEHVHQCKDNYMVKAYEKVLSEMENMKVELRRVKQEKAQMLSKMEHLEDEVKVNYRNTMILKQKNAHITSIVLTELEFLHTPCKPCERLSIECIHTTLQNPIVYLHSAGDYATFRLSDYQSNKENEKPWCSPSFYIGKGYRFCLAFHLNGMGTGKGTHVAVCLHQLIGQFDSALTWPHSFEQDLEIRLMWQETPPKDSKKKYHIGATNGSSSPKLQLSSSFPIQILVNGENTLPLLDSHRSRTKSIQSRESLSPVSSPTIKKKNLVAGVHASVLVGTAECQVMSVSSTLYRPIKVADGVAQLVGKLELFCMQKFFSSVIFLDSVVIKCRLLLEEESGCQTLEEFKIT